jgi:hypothetical protein
MQHLNRLMDEATVVVDKFSDRDPEQARWHDRICEKFEGTRVSVVATPWDQALANRVPLDLGAVAEATLDAKLAMAEVVLRGVDRANRRRLGLPEETGHAGRGQHGLAGPPGRHPQPDLAGPPRPHPQPDLAEPPRWHSQPLSPRTEADTPAAPEIPAQRAPAAPAADPDTMDDEPYVRIIPARPASEQRAD